MTSEERPALLSWHSGVRAAGQMAIHLLAICALLVVGWHVLDALGAPQAPLRPQLLAWTIASSVSTKPVLALINRGSERGRPGLRIVLSGILTALALPTSALPSLYPVLMAGPVLLSLPRSPGRRTEICAIVTTVAGTSALLFGVHAGVVDTLLPEVAGNVVAVALLLVTLVFFRFTGALAAELAASTQALFDEQARRVAELHHASTHDPLTGLLNRSGLAEAVTPALGAAEPGRGTGVIYLDLDGFKPVNDTFGHEAGDILLTAIAERLRTVMRGDPVARVGGDEFVVLVRDIPDDAALTAISERIQHALSEPVDLRGPTAIVGASAGTAWTEDPSTRLPELLARADEAMFAVKATRPDRHAAQRQAVGASAA